MELEQVTSHLKNTSLRNLIETSIFVGNSNMTSDFSEFLTVQGMYILNNSKSIGNFYQIIANVICLQDGKS